MTVIRDTIDYIKRLFGFGSAEEQKEATNDAIAWAFVLSLALSAAVVIPWPFNAVVVLIIAGWIVGRLRYHSDWFDRVWNALTLRRWH